MEPLELDDEEDEPDEDDEDEDDEEDEDDDEDEPSFPSIWLRSTCAINSHPVVDMNVSIAMPNHDAFVLLIDRTLMILPFVK